MQKSKLAAFVLSFIFPGAGHMYLGLFRRGLQFMIVFVLSIMVVSALSGMFPFAPMLAIVWFFALFDTLQRTTDYNLMVQQVRSEEHSPTPGQVRANTRAIVDALDETLLRSSVSFRIPHAWIGGLLILLGVVALLSALRPLFWNTLGLWLSQIHFAGIIVAICAIAAGMYVLRTGSRAEGRDA